MVSCQLFLEKKDLDIQVHYRNVEFVENTIDFRTTTQANNIGTLNTTQSKTMRYVYCLTQGPDHSDFSVHNKRAVM